MKNILNVNELCEFFNVSQPTIYRRLIRTGKLKTFKLGGKRFATCVAVNQCLASLQEGAE